MTRILADRRDAGGHILWDRVMEPELQAIRVAVEGPPPRIIRIPESFVGIDGRLTALAKRRLSPERVQQLERLVRQALS